MISGTVCRELTADELMNEDAPEAYAASPSGHLRIERSVQPDGAIVLRLSGDLDVESGQTLASVLRDPENTVVARVVLDIAGVEFIYSSGISVLVQARLQAGDGNRQFVLAHLPKSIDRIFDIAGIASQFTIT